MSPDERASKLRRCRECKRCACWSMSEGEYSVVAGWALLCGAARSIRPC